MVLITVRGTWQPYINEMPSSVCKSPVVSCDRNSEQVRVGPRLSIRTPVQNFEPAIELCFNNNDTTTARMANDYSSSRESDEEITEAQMGSRKRRKTSDSGAESDSELEPAPKPTAIAAISRVKPAADRQPTSKPTDVVPAISQNDGKDKISFASIDVAPWLVASLGSMEIKRPTGIQRACIPEILKGRDCIGGSRTGTGKTVAFSVPILQKWAEDPSGIFGLIIT
jgi:ATP-dependent RNA helicase DDX49/DBP8